MALEKVITSGIFSSPLFPPLMAILITLTIIHFRQLLKRERKLGDLLPGPPTVPLLGHAHYFVTNTNHEIFNKLMNFANSYGNVIRGYVGDRLIVGLTDPRDVELILGSHTHIDKSDEYRFFKPWLGNGDCTKINQERNNNFLKKQVY